MDSTNKKKAFTLIELMIVVAIIGILASIIVLNTWGAQDKAKDASIKSQMHQVENAAELMHVSNGDSYEGVCDPSDNTLSNTGELGLLEKSIMKNNGNLPVLCFESGNNKDFAAASPLVADKGKYWCLESAGATVEINGPITSATCQ